MANLEQSTIIPSLLDRLSRHGSAPNQIYIDDTERSIELSALLSHAVHGQNPSFSLRDVVHALETSGASSDLDALNVMPLLLTYEDSAADEILTLLAGSGNAKEIVMSVQESLERLYHDLISDEESARNKAFLQIERLLRVYIGAIPRLKLRKRSASETLRPFFVGIVPVIESIGSYLKKRESRLIVHLLCDLLSFSVSWAAQQDNEADLDAVKLLCKGVLSSSLAELSDSLKSNLAQRKFVARNPRLFQRASEVGASEDDALLRRCLDTALSLSYSISTLLQARTSGSLVLLSYSLALTTSTLPSPNSLLEAVFPVLITALQSNVLIDASLNILLHALYPSSRGISTSIDPEFIAPLSTVLASLASTSLDPTTRLIAFRTLGTLLIRAPVLECMSLLRDMLAESQFPSLRVAAIGLLKETVIEALASGEDAGPNLFASPEMLRTFGYIVLRTDPPDLFSESPSRASLQAFVDSQEPKRLVECLAFYYVLLMRDERNATGIREVSQIKSVEKEFLSSLRDTLRAWVEMEDIETVDEHTRMALAAIETGLERVDDAYQKLRLEPSWSVPDVLY